MTEFQEIAQQASEIAEKMLSIHDDVMNKLSEQMKTMPDDDRVKMARLISEMNSLKSNNDVEGLKKLLERCQSK
jgi:hypothetical protein